MDLSGRRSCELRMGMRLSSSCCSGTNKVDLTFKDRHGRTPLLYAAENGHEAIVQLLIAQLMDPSFYDKTKVSANLLFLHFISAILAKVGAWGFFFTLRFIYRGFGSMLTSLSSGATPAGFLPITAPRTHYLRDQKCIAPRLPDPISTRIRTHA